MQLRRQTAAHHEPVSAGAAVDGIRARAAVRPRWRDRLGGTEGNEILTSATAAVLTLLLAAEGITILRMGGLLSAHMFIGMLLIPPVLLKLGSTGYRFARYYTGRGSTARRGPRCWRCGYSLRSSSPPRSASSRPESGYFCSGTAPASS
jgi:hypothetical protein